MTRETFLIDLPHSLELDAGQLSAVTGGTRDAASGLSTGKRQMKPISLTPTIDSATLAALIFG